MCPQNGHQIFAVKLAIKRKQSWCSQQPHFSGVCNHVRFILFKLLKSNLTSNYTRNVPFYSPALTIFIFNHTSYCIFIYYITLSQKRLNTTLLLYSKQQRTIDSWHMYTIKWKPITLYIINQTIIELENWVYEFVLVYFTTKICIRNL